MAFEYSCRLERNFHIRLSMHIHMTMVDSGNAMGLAEPRSQQSKTFHQENSIGGNQLNATLEHGVVNL